MGTRIEGLVLTLAMALGAGTALADGVLKALHGGQVVETDGGIRIEFVVREGAVAAWVRDHGDRPIPPAQASGKATLLLGSRKLDVALTAEGAELVGRGAISSADKLTAILSLTVNGKPVAARFTR
jgi:hypothetical protein